MPESVLKGTCLPGLIQSKRAPDKRGAPGKSAASSEKECSRPKILGREQICFVVPPKFGTDCPLWPPGTGREPWAFPPPLRRCPSSMPAGTLSAGASLSVRPVDEILLRHPRGMRDFTQNPYELFLKGVRRWGGWRGSQYSASPNRPWPDPAPAFPPWRCCWQRGCCSGRTGGRYRRCRRPCFHCWDH